MTRPAVISSKSPDQLSGDRVVRILRVLDLPLAEISALVESPGPGTVDPVVDRVDRRAAQRCDVLRRVSALLSSDRRYTEVAKLRDLHA